MARDSMAVLYKHFCNQTHIGAVERDYEGYVSNMMREIGVPVHVKGYRYIRHAIILAINDYDYIDTITCRLYPDVAKAFDTTAPRVERAIRHAIELA